MNRNIFIILLIFIVPLAAYFGLTRDKLTTPPSYASGGAEKDITLKKVNVTNKDNVTKGMIKSFGVKLVPTTVFKDKNGNTIRRIEGSMEPEVLENYLKELVNG